MEQTDAGGNQDAEGGYDGTAEVPGRGRDNEETSSPEDRRSVRGVFTRRTDLHRDGADESRQSATVSEG